LLASSNQKEAVVLTPERVKGKIMVKRKCVAYPNSVNVALTLIASARSFAPAAPI
jgi:hypothetical protein